MATTLTVQQQEQVLYYLGWSGLTIVPTSTQYNTIVYNRMNQLLTPTIIAQVAGILIRLVNLDASIDAAVTRLAAKEVDGIKLNDDELRRIKLERRRWAKELSSYLDIPIMNQSGVNVGVIS